MGGRKGDVKGYREVKKRFILNLRNNNSDELIGINLDVFCFVEIFIFIQKSCWINFRFKLKLCIQLYCN